jgi:hypothetical protein
MGNRFTQATGIGADQRAAVLRQAQSRLGQTLALFSTLARILSALHGCHRSVNTTLQQRRRTPFHFPSALV